MLTLSIGHGETDNLIARRYEDDYGNGGTGPFVDLVFENIVITLTQQDARRLREVLAPAITEEQRDD